jgi:hypothetical protein
VSFPDEKEQPQMQLQRLEDLRQSAGMLSPPKPIFTVYSVNFLQFTNCSNIIALVHFKTGI